MLQEVRNIVNVTYVDNAARSCTADPGVHASHRALSSLLSGASYCDSPGHVDILTQATNQQSLSYLHRPIANVHFVQSERRSVEHLTAIVQISYLCNQSHRVPLK